MEPTIAAVQNKVFDPICSSCHSGNRPPGNLRLGRRIDAAELRDALVNRPSSATGVPYVTPGSTANSFLFRKVEGTHGALSCPTVRGCGFRMPPSGPLPADRLELLRRWIETGAH